MTASAQPMATSRRMPTVLVVLATCVLAVFFLAGADQAAAEIPPFCLPGSSAGHCDEPRGVAVDSETGHVYVADRKNNRVDVFEADGSFLFAFGWGVKDGTPALQKCSTETGCLKGLEGAGSGQFKGPRRVAVDNNPASSSRHDVYVFDAGNFRVQKFADSSFLLSFGSQGSGAGQIAREDDALAVGPAGTIYVGDTLGTEALGFTPRAEKFKPSGEFIEAVALAHADRLNGDLAVDSGGDMYGTFNKGGGIFKFHPNGSKFGAPYPLDPGLVGEGLAVDGTDNLYASQSEGRGKGFGSFNVISKYDAAGTPLSRFAYGKLVNRPPGLAPFESPEGDIFGSDGAAVKYLALPDPGPLAVPPSLESEGIGNTKATLMAEVNPEGKATQYRVDYVDDADFKADVKDGGDGFEGPGTKSSETLPLTMALGSEFRVHVVKATVGCAHATKELIAEGKCLDPLSAYHWRILATNADNPGGSGEARAEGPVFETFKPIEIEDLYATAVGADTATLHAIVNPLGIPASGRFEYVDDASFQESGFAEARSFPDPGKGEAEIDFGSTEAGVKRAVALFPLSPGTTYHYRLAATDPLLEAPQLSEEKTFHTSTPQSAEPCAANEAFRTGPSALLPDCRAYELVSPLDKEGGDIAVLLDGGLTALPMVLNQSSVSGAKLAYGSYRAFGDAKSAPGTSQYIALRGKEAWTSHGISPRREAPIIAPGFALDTEFKQFSADLCEAWIGTWSEPPLAAGAPTGYTNLYHQELEDPECGAGGYEALNQTAVPPQVEAPEFFLELQGSSASGSVSIFVANDALGEAVPPEPAECAKKGICRPELYAATGGQLRFLCILPGGAASSAPCTAGGPTSQALGGDRRVSVEHAISSDGSRVFWSTGSAANTPLYLRENPFGEGPECSEAASPCTIAVSKAGEEESASAGAQYWGASPSGDKAIYTTGALGAGEADLYEFTVEGEETHPIAGEVRGLVGMSADASRIYLISDEVLDAGGSEGKPNLYLYEAGEGGGYHFIATLSAADARQRSAGGVPKSASTAADLEPASHSTRVSADGLHAAFMSSASLTGYDNSDAASPEACGKPQGICDTEAYLYDASAEAGAGKLICASCNPSGGRPLGENVSGQGGVFWVSGRVPVWENSLHAARALSADGSRLYFESFDSLVPRDTNERQDVYQWEQVGTGGCDLTDATFSPDSGGCIDLISSGQSLKDSSFIEASPSGDDVFFATLSSLLSQDPGLIDIYDARVNGGFPAPPNPPAPCEGEACQSPPEAPDDPTPASASFRGAGNLEEAPARCRKGKVRRAGRCVNRKAKKRHVKKQSHPDRRAHR